MDFVPTFENGFGAAYRVNLLKSEVVVKTFEEYSRPKFCHWQPDLSFPWPEWPKQ
jgi:hypothetical protein